VQSSKNHHDDSPKLIYKNDYWLGTFTAMASPCEVLMDINSKSDARSILEISYNEAKRVEKKFSRYRDDNIIFQINNSNGESVIVDDETARLLNYASQCHELSNGKFDITSGVLRKIWKFDGSDKIANKQDVKEILKLVGWNKLSWQQPQLQLAPCMEIDFGGIGKEYAVDRAALLTIETGFQNVLINFGGDIVALGPRRNNKAWEIGLQNPDAKKIDAIGKIELSKGAIATSGDLHRYLEKDGKRYSHILDPTTGWPVKNAVRQVTVIAPTCLEAGMLSTFAILRGKKAKKFLQAQDVQFRIIN